MEWIQTQICVNEITDHPFLQDPPGDSGNKAKKCMRTGYVAAPSLVSTAEFHQTPGFGAKPFPLPLSVLFLKQNRLKDAL